jgi:hypothetical protein
VNQGERMVEAVEIETGRDDDDCRVGREGEELVNERDW